MADLWQVYRSDGSSLGPLSAGEVRDALRSGQIDPFDQVSKAGSNVRQELVEVDELFLAAEGRRIDSVYDEMKETVTNAAAAGFEDSSAADLGSTAIVTSEPQLVPRQKTKKSEPIKEPVVSESKTLVARKAKKSSKRRKDAKRFHLLDRRNRLLGPLSAAEIQSLFYRGIIERDVQVLKDKGGKSVPVQQFVAAYSGAKAKRFKSEQTRLHLDARDAQRRGDSVSYPASSVMEQLARSTIIRRTDRPGFPLLSLGLALGAMVLAGAALKIFLLDPFFSDAPLPKTEQVATRPPPVDAPRVSDERNVIKIPTPPKRKVVTKNSPSKKKKVVVKPKKKASNVASRKSRLSRPKARKPRSKPRRTSLASRPRPSVRPTPRPVVLPSPYARRVGQVVTIRKARFNTASLRKCQAKCSVSFSDSQGFRVTGVFFKQAYYSKLAKSGGRATITGRVSKQGSSYSILIQSVR